jgi:hypothetical protein
VEGFLRGEGLRFWIGGFVAQGDSSAQGNFVTRYRNCDGEFFDIYFA